MPDWTQNKAARSAAYAAKLKDPRWQKMRLEVFQRDDFACLICGAKDKTLNVHHHYYVSGAEPWEYPLEAFSTLCEGCHQWEGDMRQEAEAGLLSALKRARFMTTDVYELGLAFDSMDDPKATQPNRQFILAHALNYLFSDPDTIEAFIAAAAKRLKSGPADEALAE